MNLCRRSLTPMLVATLLALPAHAALQVVIVQGLGGEQAYDEDFGAQTAAIRKAAAQLTDAQHIHVLSGAAVTRQALADLFSRLRSESSVDDRLALYLIGHGSYDGEEYKFNIPGPDVTGREIGDWVQALPMRDQLVVATGSSSGALQEYLKNDTRVVITATRGGSERNSTRFGTEFAAALSDEAADTDKNGELSAQEAFDFTARRVKDWYETYEQLATEHALLYGDRAARLLVARSGVVGAADAAAAASAATAEQSAERRRLNDALDSLRLRKSQLPDTQYEAQLEALLLQLAALDASTAAPAPAGTP